MGSSDADKDAYDNEKPQHNVEITCPFYCGAYPVTRAQFAAFVSVTGYKTQEEQAGGKIYLARTRFRADGPRPG